MQRYSEVLGDLMKEAEDLGLDGSSRFDWLVDQARQLPMHTLPGAEDETAAKKLRPEFEKLFKKFRIGKTYYTYADPVTEEEVRASVTRCTSCHDPAPALTDESIGFRTASQFLQKTVELTSLTARAERILLAARRGGVEIQDGLLELDKAVDAQIALGALVHTFSDDEGSDFMEGQEEGVGHARKALAAGQAGLDELRQRRLGLAIALFFVLLVLLGLGFKIRGMSSGDHVASEQT
jgi:hypothetical protein